MKLIRQIGPISLIIFLAAASFRLTALDLIEFKLDEARDVYEMERFWTEPYFPERGTIQSTGVYNPPLWYYILIPLSFPSRDPQYLSFVIALINSVAVAGFYLVVKRWYGQWVGLGAGLLLAFSPWSILFSRKIWAPDMILPFLVPLFYFLHSIHLGGVKAHPRGVLGLDRKWAWFGLALVLSLIAQLHASGIFLAIALVITLISLMSFKTLHPQGVQAHPGGVFAYLRGGNLKFALLGFLISLIPLIPYLLFQLNNGCPDCRAFVTYQRGESLITNQVPYGTWDPNAFLRPFQFIGGSGWDTVLGEEGYRDFLEQYPYIKFINFIFLLEFLLLPLGVWYIFRTVHPRGAQAHPRGVLEGYSAGVNLFHPPGGKLLWVGILVLVPILYFVTRTPPHLYYFLIISPIVILVYSLGLNLFRSRIGRIGLISLIIFINILFEVSFYKYLSETRVVPGDYGATYGVVKEITEEELGHLRGNPEYSLIKAEYWVRMFLEDGR